MAQEAKSTTDANWLEASGLLHIFRTLSLAVHPAKLGIGLGGIVLTFLLGWCLDAIWNVRGGVDEAAIARFIESRELDLPYKSLPGDAGIFEVWRQHERRCVLGLLGSSLPGASVAAGTPVGAYVETHSRARPLRNLAGIVYGVWWLVRHQTLYFIFFAVGVLFIWSCAGGAICRIASLHFARDEKLTMRHGLRYAWDKLFGGFFLAPCIPLVFIVITFILLALGGLLLRLPVFGDLVGGAAFGLAIFGGFVISILLLGLLVGGHLFWPAVATEGSDAFDAFSRGLSYPLSKPWKFILYAIITLIYVSICWVFVNLFTFFMLTITRSCVAFGTAPFGWFTREVGGREVSKLELLWPMSGPNALYAWPEWSQLQWYEYISAAFIALYVIVVIGLMWSFLASFYFSGSTVIYYLLRRDVDGTDLEDAYVEEEEDDLLHGAAPSRAETETSTTPAEKETTPTTGQSPQPPPEPTARSDTPESPGPTDDNGDTGPPTSP